MTQSYQESSAGILAKLAPVSPNQQLYDAVRDLLNPSALSRETPLEIKRARILALVKNEGANLLTLYDERPIFSVLLASSSKDVDDDLQQVLTRVLAARRFVIFCSRLFLRRDAALSMESWHYTNEGALSQPCFWDAVGMSLICSDMSHAVLIACMLETVLKENYAIPLRSATKLFPIRFNKREDNTIELEFYYTPQDYLKISGASQFEISDKVLMSMFYNPEKNYYDYCALTYGVKNTHGIVPPPRPLVPQDMTSLVLAVTADSSPMVLDLPIRLLVVTRTVLGSGNYLNARLTMEGLCRTMPHIRIDWVVAHDGDILPRTAPLPPQITCYETDALWKLFPVIRALSLDAQFICSLPNFFLIDAENKFLPLTLSDSVTSRFIMLNEYNSAYSPEQVPPYYLSLISGINAGAGSLGIIKPALLRTADSLAEKRVLLSMDDKAKLIFSTNPEAPLYFAYGYLPKKGGHSSIAGMKLVDFFALFIEHAKRSGHRLIKIVMPIDLDSIREARDAYPSILDDCAIDYIDSMSASTGGHEASLKVEVFHLFPFDNTSFRLLMDYAASNHTPIAVTGDQSFIETFFMSCDHFIFLYQLIEHKKDLLEQIKLITEERGLDNIAWLIDLTEKGCQSEAQIVEMAGFILTNQEALEREASYLSAEINAQPDLVNALSQLIGAIVPRHPTARLMAPAEPAVAGAGASAGSSMMFSRK